MARKETTKVVEVYDSLNDMQLQHVRVKGVPDFNRYLTRYPGPRYFVGYLVDNVLMRDNGGRGGTARVLKPRPSPKKKRKDNPGARIWWMLGIGTAAIASVAGGVLVYRGMKSKRGQEPMDPDVVGEGGVPPHPPPPPPKDDLGFATPPVDFSKEICVQWEQVNSRPDWRPELYDFIGSAISMEMRDRDVAWVGVEQLNNKSFVVARAALSSVCPDVVLPKTIDDIQRLKEKNRYWTELWDAFYNRTSFMLSGLK